MLTSSGYIIFVAFIIENVFLPKNTKKMEENRKNYSKKFKPF